MNREKLYAEMYISLYNSVSDTINILETNNDDLSLNIAKILKNAQNKSEELFLS